MKVTEEALGVELKGLPVHQTCLSVREDLENKNDGTLVFCHTVSTSSSSSSSSLFCLQSKLIKSGTLPSQQYVTHHIAFLLHSTVTLHAKGLNALFFLCEKLFNRYFPIEHSS